MPEIKGFRLLKPFGNYKVGKMYSHYGGLVSGLSKGITHPVLIINFLDPTWFKPVYKRTKPLQKTYTRDEVFAIVVKLADELILGEYSMKSAEKWFKKNVK